MPSFKPKSNKKIRVCKKYTTTLDGKHKEFINEFSKNEIDTIPKLKQEKVDLQKKIKTLDKTANIEQIMDMKDRVNEINELIKELKAKKNNYFLDNSKFIFEYFENKKNINNTDTLSSNKCFLISSKFKAIIKILMRLLPKIETKILFKNISAISMKPLST